LPKDIPEINTGLFKRAMAIRCDTRSCFNVRSKANISQLNLPYGTKLKKWKSEKLKKYKRREMLRSIGKQSGESVESVSEKKKGYSGKALQKRKVLSLE